MVNKPLIRPYFLGGGYVRGGWLNSHEYIIQQLDAIGGNVATSKFVDSILGFACWMVGKINKKSPNGSLKVCLDHGKIRKTSP